MPDDAEMPAPVTNKTFCRHSTQSDKKHEPPGAILASDRAYLALTNQSSQLGKRGLVSGREGALGRALAALGTNAESGRIFGRQQAKGLAGATHAVTTAVQAQTSQHAQRMLKQSAQSLFRTLTDQWHWFKQLYAIYARKAPTHLRGKASTGLRRTVRQFPLALDHIVRAHVDVMIKRCVRQ